MKYHSYDRSELVCLNSSRDCHAARGWVPVGFNEARDQCVERRAHLTDAGTEAQHLVIGEMQHRIQARQHFGGICPPTPA
jgi:hypothetical protein